MSITTEASLWEPLEDSHGNVLILPSYMKVFRCFFCHYLCSRKLAMLTLPKLRAYLEQGLLRRWAGYVDVKVHGKCERKPCCHYCARGKVVRQ